jgi:hypothetical protein
MLPAKFVYEFHMIKNIFLIFIPESVCDRNYVVFLKYYLTEFHASKGKCSSLYGDCGFVTVKHGVTLDCLGKEISQLVPQIRSQLLV